MIRLRLLIGAVVVFALIACSDDPTGLTRVDRVEVSPEDITLVAGDSVELTAVALSAKGEPVDGVIYWRSMSPHVATVRAYGDRAMVVAAAAGTVRIEAESGGRAGYVDVTVGARPQVGSVDIEPGSLVLVPGQQIAVRAEVKSTTGEVLQGRAVTWTVEPEGAATITPQANGWATVNALATGQAYIRAAAEGAQGQAWLQVVPAQPPPQPIASLVIAPGSFTMPVNHETTLQAIAKTESGEIVQGRPVTWTVVTPAVAAVTPIPASPFASVRTLSPGSTVVRATIDGVSAEITVGVTANTPPPQQIGYLFFSVGRRGIWRGQFESLKDELVALGTSGRIENPQVEWSVEDETIATIDSAGVVRGLVKGTTRVFAKHGSLTATISVTVFEGVGPVAVFDLTYDWWDNQWHMPPQVGTRKWTDEQGVEHDVALYAVSGTLTMHSNGDYERRLVIEGWAHTSTGARKVVELEDVDAGTSTIIVGGETGYRMYSSTRQDYTWDVVGAHNAGHVRMRAVIGTASLHEYMFRLRQ